MEYIGSFIVGIILLYLVVKLLSWPIKVLYKLIVNGVLGAVLLFVVNLIGSQIGISIAINAWSALIAGFFGIPGVIFLVIFKMYL
ncbi:MULTISPECIES: pro-sigmaK processing inhibitor BofA family protein [Clostridium]|uniref:Sigma-K factor processing regulatory protein BOFA n=1 Tax=Clostridium novyi (strain NT) TaxID=386415 RepID=A0Q3R2_CLONN|nr:MULTISPECIES: pro-sigmaK processing inhibitor BofA family protein [Clostridium]ABK62657.1 Sigma-K factor processing regulatory protein BOFA [Clostridium novyi NT]KEH85276.1 sigma-K factor processing regulatory protein BOFA [Clostridium novyi A str. NCTC 538]KEH86031.1 sigma-K factor processing regulatory protein BOFA [Clostridium novyi A str. 4540]KEH92037.1 sigma-K factor processing regulatory protein BOFA [Clostridium novyi A str. GD211209]KEH92116.1 sigma-K factor processing regulatory p